jgi:hypothetical protein
MQKIVSKTENKAQKYARPVITEVPILQKFAGMTRAEFIAMNGKRGIDAIALAEDGKVVQYNDATVVLTKGGAHEVANDECDCMDFRYRRVFCKHILAVQLAQENGTVIYINAMFKDLKNGQTQITALA